MEKYPDDHPFKLLRFSRNKTETIYRRDRYFVKRSWLTIDQKGVEVRHNETLFYPSEYGIEMIEEYRKSLVGIEDTPLNKWQKEAQVLVRCWDQLRLYGNGNTKIIVNKEIGTTKQRKAISIKNMASGRNRKKRLNLKKDSCHDNIKKNEGKKEKVVLQEKNMSRSRSFHKTSRSHSKAGKKCNRAFIYRSHSRSRGRNSLRVVLQYT